MSDADSAPGTSHRMGYDERKGKWTLIARDHVTHRDFLLM